MTDAWSSHDRGPEGDRSTRRGRGGLQMPLERVMLTQRAVRKVLPDPVDDAIVLRCIELALQAPTGSNGQNWEFVVVRDRAAKERLGVQYQRAWSLYGRMGRRLGGTGRATSPWPRSCVRWSGRSSISPSSGRGGGVLARWPAAVGAAAGDRRFVVLRLDLSRGAEPALGGAGDGTRGVAGHACRCGARRSCAASSGSRCRCSRAARCRWAGPSVATARPLASRSATWSTSTATATGRGEAVPPDRWQESRARSRR